MTTFKEKKKMKDLLICIISICIALTTFGCESNTGTGTLVGTGIGALAGQVIGGNTTATLVGAGIGAGAGYLIGNAKDKKTAEAYNYNSPTPLSGTKWKVMRLEMEDKPEYEWITAEFRKDGIVETIRAEPGGTKIITQEKYRIVGNTLIVNKTDYIVNAEYSLHGNELILKTEDVRVVLQKI